MFRKVKMKHRLNKTSIIRNLYQESVFNHAPKIQGKLASDVKKELLSRGADSNAISSIPLPILKLIFGILSGIESGGNVHAIVGRIGGGQPSVIGAASNNIDNISIKDAYNDIRRILTFGAVGGASIGMFGGPLGLIIGAVIGTFQAALIPAIQYGFGKLFGSTKSQEDYKQYLLKNSRLLNKI